MINFNNLRLGARITVILGFILFISILAIIWQLYQTYDLAKNVTNQLLQDKIKSDIKSMDNYVKLYFGKIQMDPSEKLVDEQGESLIGRYEMIDKLSKDLGVVATIFAAERNDFIRIATSVKKENGERAIGTYLGTDSAAYGPVRNRTQYVGEAKILEKPYVTGYNPIIDKDNRVIGILFLGIPKTRIDNFINESIGSKLKIGIVAIIIFIGFSIGAGIVFIKGITEPIKKSLVFSNMLSRGDFTERIDLSQKDELGQLGTALNEAADGLEKLIADIMIAVQNLSQAVEQISSGNQNLSHRTSEQASSLEEIASTIEQATAAINQNYENAAEANNLAENSTRLATDGGVLVSDAVGSINEINQTSKKIGEIISLINEISFQTNLLALNAAVEAARAGEQGRGFAVVAGEVRNLAQRSGNAAKEINTLIKDSMEKIEAGTGKANRSGEALKEIIESVRGVGRVVAEITASSQEQKQGINQINNAVAEMDNMTQQNAALVEQTASASEAMSNQAADLMSMMERFRIREDKKRVTYANK